MRQKNNRQARKRIAIFDNNELENLLRLSNQGISIAVLLECYDYILIPGWVYEEVSDSEFRIRLVHELEDQGLPIHVLQEDNYTKVIPQEMTLIEFFSSAISPYAQLKGQFRRLILKNREPMDIEFLYSEWISLIYEQWPFKEYTIRRSSGIERMKKKNAGEISIAFLTGLLKTQQIERVEVTIWSGDGDCRKCIEKITDLLEQRRNGLTNEQFSVSYKNLDVILKELYEEGIVDNCCVNDIIDNVRTERKICYVEKKVDYTSEIKTAVVSNERFKEIVRDENTIIVW